MGKGNRAATQPLDFDLTSLDTVSSMPNTQSTIKPSLRLLDLDFNVASPEMSRVAVRQAVAHAIDRTDLLNRSVGHHRARPGGQRRSPGRHSPSPATRRHRPRGSTARRDPVTTDRLLRSLGYRRMPTGQYVDATGAPLTLRMAVQTGDPWTIGLAAQITAQLHQVGIAVVTMPVSGTASLRHHQLRHGPGHPGRRVRSRRSPRRGTRTPRARWDPTTTRTGATSTIPRWTSCSPRRPRHSIRSPEEPIYDQIDDQLWDQMVSLPLFAEPGFEANGVQLANVEYNPSTDGILWNVALWTTLKPGPATKQS